MDENRKSTFDRLVAGLNAEERTAMLSRLNSNGEKNIEIVNDSQQFDSFSGSLSLRLKNESIFYRFFLWLRSFFSKSSQESIYNEDVLLSMARKINREHPGIINPQGEYLDSLFFERLTSLKTAADFYKPYLYLIEESPGAFYVFLSSFVAPQLSDQINSVADPYNLPENTEPTNEIRTDLLRKLDDVLKNMQHGTKSKIYEAVKSVQWLTKFANLPFLHFIAQFTDIKDGVYTCPYVNAKVDFNIFASVFDSNLTVPNEVMEAIFLFSQKKEISGNFMTADIEASVKKFMSASASHFTNIKMFLNIVPVSTVGKIISKDYDWAPSTTGGGEDWNVKFRNQWRKIIEIRWTEYLRDQKRINLESGIQKDFGLEKFPELPNRPWVDLWGGMPFNCEMTGGFLGWYVSEVFPADQKMFNIVIMEGIFLRSENRTEFADALDKISKVAEAINKLLEDLDYKGVIGNTFEELSGSASRTFNAQNTAENLITKIESEIRGSAIDFCNAARIIETIFKGIFEEVNDGVHATMQNLNTLKGHENLRFKDDLREARNHIKQVLFYLSELEPIEKG